MPGFYIAGILFCVAAFCMAMAARRNFTLIPIAMMLVTVGTTFITLAATHN